MRQSAGGVVVGSDGRIVVVNTNGDSWSLPKGGIDEGETAQEAATREIAEESGITGLIFMKKLGEYERCKIGKGGIGEDCTSKAHITMFYFTTDKTEFNPEDPIEHPEVRWIAVDEVAELLTHPKDAEFFESIKDKITEEK